MTSYRLAAPLTPLLLGCATSPQQANPSKLVRGITIVLPGINGQGSGSAAIVQGLAQGGVPTAIESFDWTSGQPLAAPWHLHDKIRHAQQAQRLAAKIVCYQNRYPDRPVHLVGVSAGAGIALQTLESLPGSRRVTSTVLLSPAVSPNYQLTAALRGTETGITSFNSPLDVVLLAGTTVVGTYDGHWTPGAGAVGFQTEHRKLRQFYYEPQMARSGNYGGHWGTLTVSFNRDYVAPVIRSADLQHRLARLPLVRSAP